MLSQLLLSLLLSYSLNYSADWTISHLFPDMIAVNPKTHQASQGQMSLILLVQPQLWYQIIMQTWGYTSRTSRQKALRLAVNSFCMWKRFNIISNHTTMQGSDSSREANHAGHVPNPTHKALIFCYWMWFHFSKESAVTGVEYSSTLNDHRAPALRLQILKKAQIIIKMPMCKEDWCSDS